MTATDELRRLLDERGVEWKAGDTYRLFVTSWKDADGHGWTFVEYRDGSFSKLTAYHLTPAQAVEATLGRGTCKNVHEPPRNTTFWPAPHFKCSECGATHVSMEYVFYCPNCGREVVEG